MMESVSKNMILGDSTNTLGLNLVCSVAVVIFVAAMCILFTGKLKKISAIEAIRNGDNGERYHKRRGLNLHTKKRMGTIAFLTLYRRTQKQRSSVYKRQRGDKGCMIFSW